MSLKIVVGAATHVGMKRTQNQDNYAADLEHGFFLIADGMGGHRGGETASQIAVDAIIERIQASGSRTEPRAVITDAITSANERIQARGMQEPQLKGMGTTSTLLLIRPNPRDKEQTPRGWVGHVGDSRCYLIKRGEIWQVTRDHSLVQEKLRAGLITRAEVKTDRMKNVITRSVGFEKLVDIELYDLPAIEAGDTFVLCSDGLSGMVDDATILAAVSRQGADAQAIADSLIEAANQAGGDDNVTAIVVRAV